MRIATALPAALAALAASAILPAVAPAATIARDGAALVYTAVPGTKVSFGVQAGTDPGSVLLYTSGDTMTGLPGGCTPSDLYGGDVVECTGVSAVRADLGDGDDSSTVSSEVTTPLTIAGGAGADWLRGNEHPQTFDGGAGDDRLVGEHGDDTLIGGDGADDIEGKGGADRLDGGAGNDALHPDGYEQPAADVVDGGAGVDTIDADYSSRFSDEDPPLAITLAGAADDGRPGEGDDLRNVEKVVTSVGGRFTGTDGPDGFKLAQVLTPSELIGLGGDDALRGGDGPDRLDGGTGDDALDAGFGDDVIVGGPGRDAIWGDLAGGDCGPYWCKLPYGNDVIEARDGEVDSINCGAGADRVVADAADVVAPDCETVERGAPAPDPGTPAKPGDPAGPGGPSAATLAAVKGQKLRSALKRGLKVRVTGLAAGTKVKALRGKRTVAAGTVKAGSTITLKFTKQARRSLARKRTVKLTIAAGTVRSPLTLR